MPLAVYMDVHVPASVSRTDWHSGRGGRAGRLPRAAWYPGRESAPIPE